MSVAAASARFLAGCGLFLAPTALLGGFLGDEGERRRERDLLWALVLGQGGVDLAAFHVRAVAPLENLHRPAFVRMLAQLSQGLGRRTPAPAGVGALGGEQL